jgi:thiamine pyrophosphate-dependent acetolactate synthase large subunit-like protein
MTRTPLTLQRRGLVAGLLARRGSALVVAGLGSPSWDVFAAGDHPDYFYAWGGMGLAVPVALGLALAQPHRRVLAVTGDGEMLMGIGSLAVVGDQAPRNLAVLVLDNESFAETGGQRGLTAKAVDIAAVARGCGIAHTLTASTDRVEELAALLFASEGPALAVAKVAVTRDPWALPERDGAAIANRFRSALGLTEA